MTIEETVLGRLPYTGHQVDCRLRHTSKSFCEGSPWLVLKLLFEVHTSSLARLVDTVIPKDLKEHRLRTSSDVSLSALLLLTGISQERVCIDIPCFIALCFIELCRYCVFYKLKALWEPESSQFISSIFPIALIYNQGIYIVVDFFFKINAMVHWIDHSISKHNLYIHWDATKKDHVTHLWYLLYCNALEPNPQYHQGMPINMCAAPILRLPPRKHHQNTEWQELHLWSQQGCIFVAFKKLMYEGLASSQIWMLRSSP